MRKSIVTAKNASTPKTSRNLRVGVASIRASIPEPNSLTSEQLFVQIGQNTGNLMFTNAIYHLVDAETINIGFDFDAAWANANLDLVVVPAANWLNATTDWTFLIRRLEALDIPAVAVGLGLQSLTTDLDTVEVTDSAIHLAQVFASKGPAISVRGDFTRRWLNKIGIFNVVTTGCPSLYMNIFGERETPPRIAKSNIILQSTRYRASGEFARSNGLNRNLFSQSVQFNMPMIYQSEVEEIEFLVFGKSILEQGQIRTQPILDLYGFDSVDKIESHLRRSGKVFFDLDLWSKYVVAHEGVLGSRLHGAILALNSGRPAVLVPHDSRTAEIASFAAIPTAFGPDIRDIKHKDALVSRVAEANTEHYRDRRSMNQDVFIKFLADVGLRPKYENLF